MHVRALAGFRTGDVPDGLVERLIAVDGSVLTALPQIVGRLGETFRARGAVCLILRACSREAEAGSINQEQFTKANGVCMLMCAFSMERWWHQL